MNVVIGIVLTYGLGWACLQAGIRQGRSEVDGAEYARGYADATYDSTDEVRAWVAASERAKPSGQ